MIEFLKEFCKKNKVNKINGKYRKTEKNSLCFHFFNKMNLINNNKFAFEFATNTKKLNLFNIAIKKPLNRKK